VTKFYRYDLRTTDADGARAFYAKVLGHDRSVIWPLHEQALARGARPHWLGQLEVDDAERVALAFVERGAVRYGPTRPSPDGGQFAVLGDPGGALVAVATPPPGVARAPVDVVWHVLHTSDARQAAVNYSELFGWQLTERVERGVHGAFQHFAWHAGGESAGAIADIAARPGVHPQWLFFFEVDDLETAMARARAGGGVVVDSFVLPTGERGCVCDDAQGAAFALRERRRVSA
jgi:predicted enzyme related to lactoylglutathione lyase